MNPKAFDAAAVLHREVATRVLSRLELMKLQPQRILELGCATGYATKLLEKRYPKAQILAVDIAITMLKFAKHNRKWFSKQRYINADLAKLPFIDHSIDFIFSNLNLHRCINTQEVLQEWQRVLRPEGLLMFTTFGPETLKELRSAWTQVDNYGHIHDFKDMHDLGDELLRAGFADPVMDMEVFTLTYKSLRELIYELKALNVQCLPNNRRQGLTPKSVLAKLELTYENYRQADGVLPVTAEIVYGHAWGRKIMLQKQGEIAIPVSSIKWR